MSNYVIQNIDPTNTKQVNKFINLPYKIYGNHTQWVPPLNSDIRYMLNHQKNPFYKHSKAIFLLALDGNDQPVGRLACLINTQYNQYNQSKFAFFYLFEAFNIPEASLLLFNTAFEWAHAEGMENIAGPKGFSPSNGLGLLVEGFDYLPAYGVPYNPPYYASLLEQAGFTKSTEILSGFIKAGIFVDEKIDLISRRVQERRGLYIAQCKTRKDLRRLKPKLQNLYNDGSRGTVGGYPLPNVPLTQEESKKIVDQFYKIADPKLLKFVMKEDQVVGYILAYPDISKALKRCNGRLFPFGWLDILISLKTTNVADINGAGMIEEYRGSGGTAILFNEFHKSARESHYTRGEIVQVGTENTPMLRELSNFGIVFHKKHGIFTRSI